MVLYVVSVCKHAMHNIIICGLLLLQMWFLLYNQTSITFNAWILLYVLIYIWSLLLQMQFTLFIVNFQLSLICLLLLNNENILSDLCTYSENIFFFFPCSFSWFCASVDMRITWYGTSFSSPSYINICLPFLVCPTLPVHIQKLVHVMDLTSPSTLVLFLEVGCIFCDTSSVWLMVIYCFLSFLQPSRLMNLRLGSRRFLASLFQTKSLVR